MKHSFCRGAFFMESEMETLKINGIESQFPDGVPKTIADLLKNLDINEATVVAELEGKIINKEDFAGTALSSGQNIELIRFVGGG